MNKTDKLVAELVSRGISVENAYAAAKRHLSEKKAAVATSASSASVNAPTITQPKPATDAPKNFMKWAHKAMRSLQKGVNTAPLHNREIGEEIQRLRALSDLDPYAFIQNRCSNELAKGNGKYWDKLDHGTWLPRLLPSELTASK